MVSPKEMYVFTRCICCSCVSSGGCVVHLLAQEMKCVAVMLLRNGSFPCSSLDLIDVQNIVCACVCVCVCARARARVRVHVRACTRARTRAREQAFSLSVPPVGWHCMTSTCWLCKNNT